MPRIGICILFINIFLFFVLVTLLRFFNFRIITFFRILFGLVFVLLSHIFFKLIYHVTTGLVDFLFLFICYY